MKKSILMIAGGILIAVGLLLLYLGQAPLPSILIVIGYILFSIGLIPSKEEKDDKAAKS